MGEVAEAMTKKKKKGRPSLLDLQKRALKQQQLQEQQQEKQKRSTFKNPNSLNLTSASAPRSARRHPYSDGIAPDAVCIEEDDDDERKEKKHKLLHGLNSHIHRHSPIPSANSSGPNSLSGGSDLNVDEAAENSEASLKRPRIPVGEKVSKATDSQHESQVESGPTTPLPAKKLLVFILDRLQKKDTYGVFSEPVDPEELPDYHDIIANPMDFSTIKKKLNNGAYANLEQFERDVFLICANAMEYNSPDTIYFRQAKAMQELAKKDFANLRQDSDDEEPQPKVVRRGRPPGKNNTKKMLDSSLVDRVEYSGGAMLATGGETMLSNGYNLRKAPNTLRLRPSDTFGRAIHTSHGGENHSGWSNEWENEFPASVVRAVAKYGMKHFIVDENRRDTYNQAMHVRGQSVLASLEGESKQLIPVGLSCEYGYARSLARFAANLGPIAWRIASKKIEAVLPSGYRYGPGWIGDSHSSEESQQQSPSFVKQKPSSSTPSDDHLGRVFCQSTSVSNSTMGNKRIERGGGETEFRQRLAPGNGLNPSPSSLQILQPKGLVNSDSRNGFTSGFTQHEVGGGSYAMLGVQENDFSSSGANWAEAYGRQHLGNLTSTGSMIRSFTSVNEGPHGPSSGQGLSSPMHKRDAHQIPRDLNANFPKPVSPNAGGVQIGSPKQPDLALQL